MNWAELCCHSYYSFLDGASAPEDLAQAAADAGVTALGLTDRDGLYGVIPFYKSCKELGIHPVIGADLSIEGGDRLIVLCPDMNGYAELSKAITASYAGREKGDPLVTHDILAQLSPHVFAIAAGKSSRITQLLQNKNRPEARRLLQYYQSLWGERLYCMLNLHLDEGDLALAQQCADLAEELHIPLIASNTPRYATQERGMLYDVLRCIKVYSTRLPQGAAWQSPAPHQGCG